MAIPAAIVGMLAKESATVAGITASINQATNRSESLIKKAIHGIIGAITELADQFDRLKSVILDTVKAFAPFTIIMFNRAMLDLKATIGQIFLPIVKQAILVVRQLADIIYNLPPGVKTAIRAITEIILAISGITAIVVGVVGGIASVVTAIAGFIAGLVVIKFIIGALLVPLAFLAMALAPLVVIATAVGAALVAVVVGFVALVRAMLQTEGGSRLLKNIVRGFYQIVNAVQTGFGIIMKVIGPVLDQLYSALSQLGDALSELFNALKPLIAAGLIVIIGALATVLTILAKAATAAVTVITFAINLLNKIPAIRIARAIGEMMPEGEEKKSAYGLGWAQARVSTDPNALYNQITEELLRNTRMGGGKAPEDPAKQAAKNTGDIKDILQNIWQFLQQQGEGGMMGQLKRFNMGAAGLFIR